MVREFLAKPVIVKQGVFGAQASGAQLDTVLLPFDVIAASNTVSLKLAGYLSFRYTAVVTV